MNGSRSYHSDALDDAPKLRGPRPAVKVNSMSLIQAQSPLIVTALREDTLERQFVSQDNKTQDERSSHTSHLLMSAFQESTVSGDGQSSLQTPSRAGIALLAPSAVQAPLAESWTPSCEGDNDR